MFCTFAHSSLIIWYMLYYIKKYPFSLAIILVVIYLSFFKPPKMDDIPLFPGVDKVVHFCMYGGMSGMLWLEFLGITGSMRRYYGMLGSGQFYARSFEWDY